MHGGDPAGAGGAASRAAREVARPRAFKRICSHFIQASGVPTLERLGLLEPIVAAGGSRPGPRLGALGLGRGAAGSAALGVNLRRELLDPLVREPPPRRPGWSSSSAARCCGRVGGGGGAAVLSHAITSAAKRCFAAGSWSAPTGAARGWRRPPGSRPRPPRTDASPTPPTSRTRPLRTRWRVLDARPSIAAPPSRPTTGSSSTSRCRPRTACRSSGSIRWYRWSPSSATSPTRRRSGPGGGSARSSASST